MTFGIEKCATMVIKPMNFQSPPNYSDPIFYLGMNVIPKVSIRISLLSFTRFFSNKLIPIAYKKKVLQSLVFSKVIYYSPLLDSNKSRTARIQTLINTGLFWCIGSFSKNGKTSSENNDYIRYNSTMSTYALSRDLSIPPIAGVCAALQIKSFAKWSKSNCIIKDLIKSIPKMPYYSWTKESRTLYKKIKKYKCEKYDDILERYWKSVAKFQGIKGQNYDCNKFSNNKAIIMLSLKYPQFNLGFSWIIRLRCGYKYSTTIAIRMGRVSEDCPKWNSLNFIDDLYVLFLRKIRVFNPLSSYDSISDFEDYINHYIYLFLLGGTLVLNELHFDSGEQRQLNELLFKGSSESPVPKIVGLAEFLTRAMPIISSSFELLFDRYCKIPNLSKSVDVVLIRHNDNTGSSSISMKDESRPSNSINDEPGESLVDTTLSIIKMLLLEHKSKYDFDICIGNGSQDVLFKAFIMLHNKGDSTLIEKPVYTDIETYGNDIIPETFEESFENWDELSQNQSIPTGCQCFIGKKEERIPSYFSIDVDGCILRFDSFSKILSSGIRIGWVSGPKPLVNCVVLHYQAANLHVSAVLYKQKCNILIKSAKKFLYGLAEWNTPFTAIEKKALMVPGFEFFPNSEVTSYEEIDEVLKRLASLLNDAIAA
ncbi:pyridoxal phosphate-dependent transferase [Neocallimastix lanati (nom. inval.)]|nr:pyridoxal phosphate-dependent transferase [Neocallimastix sp. JGI-2020a]